MEYAIVAEYADGGKFIQHITQKAVRADKENFYLGCFIYDDTLHIEYVKNINPNSIIHPIERACIGISLNNCLSVMVYNVDGLTLVDPWKSLYYRDQQGTPHLYNFL